MEGCAISAGELGAIVHRLHGALTPVALLPVSPLVLRPSRRTGAPKERARSGPAESVRPAAASRQAAVPELWATHNVTEVEGDLEEGVVVVTDSP